MHQKRSTINIGLIGAGVIGGGVIKLFDLQGQFFSEKQGLPLVLKRIVDTRTERFAELPVGKAICTAHAEDILNDPEIQIVIELVGGTTFARTLILSALAKKKHVVTANKALLAEHGPEIFGAAEKAGVSVYFEAAVGGGMPVIKTIREALVGNDVRCVKTIINGTCNYILTQMTEKEQPFAKVLAMAQKRGYAEADPTLDVEGGDAGHKVAIMASLLYDGYMPYDKVSREGITNITPEDISFARDLGYKIKLLGVIQRDSDGAPVEARVHPALLHNSHILASVSDVYNAVWLSGDAVGDMLLYGRGAGELPTASAVIGDVVDVARNIAAGTPDRVPMSFYSEDNLLPVKPLDDIMSRYYLRFTVLDRPGVLASISSAFAKYGISIAAVIQREHLSGQTLPVVFSTREVQEKQVREVISEIEKMDFIKNATQLIRIED
jgi:homoserine dehydrogenase